MSVTVSGCAVPSPEKSTLWTDAGVGQNFQRDLGAIGPHELYMDQRPLCLVFREIRMDQWPFKFAQSFPPEWHWSMDGSSSRRKLTRNSSQKAPELQLHTANNSPHFFESLASQKIAIAIAAFFKSLIQNHNSHCKFHRKIADKSRNEIINRLRFEIRKFQIAMIFAYEASKTSRRCPNFQR